MDVANGTLPDSDSKRKARGRTIGAVAAIALVAVAVGYGWKSYRDFEARSKFAAVYTQAYLLQAEAKREFAVQPGAGASGDREVVPDSPYVRRLLVSRAQRSIYARSGRIHVDVQDRTHPAPLRFRSLPRLTRLTCSGRGA